MRNFLTHKLGLNKETLSASGNVLFLNGHPLLTDAESVLLTGDQYISGKKEFEEALIYSGDIEIHSLNTEGHLLISSDGATAIDWDGHILQITGLTSLDWESRLLYKNSPNFLELETTLDWDQRILSGNWSAESPQEDWHIATKGYVDQKVVEVIGEGSIRISSPVPTGVDSYFIEHQNLGGETSVVGNLKNENGGWHFLHMISGNTPTGFHVVFSDTIDSEGYYFECHVLRTGTVF